jgi:hypothetical protein
MYISTPKTQHTTVKYSQQLSKHSRTIPLSGCQSTCTLEQYLSIYSFTKLQFTSPDDRLSSLSTRTPSLTPHLWPTGESFNRTFCRNLPTRTNSTNQSKSADSNLVTIESISLHVHCRVRNNFVLLPCYVTVLYYCIVTWQTSRCEGNLAITRNNILHIAAYASVIRTCSWENL